MIAAHGDVVLSLYCDSSQSDVVLSIDSDHCFVDVVLFNDRDHSQDYVAQFLDSSKSIKQNCSLLLLLSNNEVNQSPLPSLSFY